MSRFDSHYRKHECYWGKQPSALTVELLRYKNSGDVLDLGVGEGRDALFLEKNGFNLTGVDTSNAGIEKFRSSSRNLGLRVQTHVADIRDFKYTKDYDVIISNATLHFLPEEDINSVIEKMKLHTRSNGINTITAFNTNNPDMDFPHLFRKSELREFYKDWEILTHSNLKTSLQRHGDGPWHSHSVTSIMARRNQ
jgi:tellurite methyltransferase